MDCGEERQHALTAGEHSARSLDGTERTRFFVAGAPKAGTTALCEFLGQHPQIFMCPVKEPSFFAARELLADDVLLMRDWNNRLADSLALNWNTYEALFEGVRDELAIGEGSTVYLSTPGAPRAIHEHFPGARFVLILRDPAERFFSHYLATRWGHPLRTCRECIALAHEGWNEWGAVLDVGRYATHLKRFFEAFPRQQFGIYLYEDFCADQRAVCRAIFSFLGVRADCPVDVSKRMNEPLLPRWAYLHALLRAVPMSHGLSALVPRRWRERLRRAYKKPRSGEVMAPADRRILVNHYREEIEQTSELIERDLSSWLR